MSRSVHGLAVVATALLILPAVDSRAADRRAGELRAAEAPQCVAHPFGFADSGPRVAPPRGGTGAPALAPPPTVGGLHLLVILAEFSDVPAQLPPSRFQSHLFGTTGATLRDYYRAASDDQLDVTGTVVGWVTLPQPEFFYSQGGGGVGAYPNNGQRMTEDAVTAAVAAGTDLGDFDADGDGVVDALLVIHSGQGLEWAAVSAATPQPNPDAINSHKWAVTRTEYGSGARVVEYFTCPELQIVHPGGYPGWSDTIATIGVFCHELGHVLGLPDYYDTITFDNRVGAWDIMDVGNWLYDAGVDSLSVPGSLPTRFSAWSRLLLGWTTSDTLLPGPVPGEENVGTFRLGSGSTGGRPLQLLGNPGGVDWTGTSPGTGEYFLAEVRTAVGYDAGLPSEGLLVYHVDEARPNNRESEAPFRGGGLLVLAPEDGNFALNTTSSDPWPGSQIAFDATSDPSSNLHNGTESGVAITRIDPIVGGFVDLEASVVRLTTPPALPYAQPHPWHVAESPVVELVIAGSSGAAPTPVEVFDARGRHVRTLEAVGGTAHWDGRSDAGRRLPVGMYFFRAPGLGTGGKVLLLR